MSYKVAKNGYKHMKLMENKTKKL